MPFDAEAAASECLAELIDFYAQPADQAAMLERLEELAERAYAAGVEDGGGLRETVPT